MRSLLNYQDLNQTKALLMWMTYKKTLLLLAFISTVILTSCSGDDNTTEENISNDNVYYRGMDLSFMPENLQRGVVFKDQQNNDISTIYGYLADRGVNLVRIRLWVNNTDQQYNLNNLLAQTREVQDAGMEYLLDFHYSDIWADPGSQDTPAVWSALNASDLSIAIANYTDTVLTALKNQNTLPAIVQIGNETNNGMLWSVGQVYTSAGESWDNYALISRAAIETTQRISPESEIMIHYAGVDDGMAYFYNQLTSRGVDYDIAGLSYYPWWSESDVSIASNKVAALATQLDKDIMIVETAYPFSLDFNDNSNNIIGLPAQLSSGYPATQNGQYLFLQAVDNMMKALPDNRGRGYCYWSPDWVTYPGNDTSYTNGSSWENMCLFDFNTRATTAMSVYALE